MRNKCVRALLICSFLLGLSPLDAAPTGGQRAPMIQRGIDVFVTPADGRTYYDFAQTPIPAGFFCNRSKAFTGRVTFKGLPLATGAPGQLWNGDTVVERLDDSAFDAKGIAETRLQFRALSLVSIRPIKTACGAFHAFVSLSGQQRVTTMSIQRTQEGGGTFSAPLALDVRVTFIPVKPSRNNGPRQLELTSSFTFPASPLPWSFTAGPRTKAIGSALVDTNGDLTPDTRLPGTSNFSPGRSPEHSTQNKFGGECGCAETVCHLDPSTGKEHCYTQPPPPPPPYCNETPCF